MRKKEGSTLICFDRAMELTEEVVARKLEVALKEQIARKLA